MAVYYLNLKSIGSFTDNAEPSKTVYLTSHERGTLALEITDIPLVTNTRFGVYSITNGVVEIKWDGDHFITHYPFTAYSMS